MTATRQESNGNLPGSAGRLPLQRSTASSPCFATSSRLAPEEWGHIAKVPKRSGWPGSLRVRVVWLEATEEAALLKACASSQNPHLLGIGDGGPPRPGCSQRREIMGLTWDRVDRARGVLMLERTKSGKRREVPMQPEVGARCSRRYRSLVRGLRLARQAAFARRLENAVKAAGAQGLQRSTGAAITSPLGS